MKEIEERKDKKKKWVFTDPYDLAAQDLITDRNALPDFWTGDY